jgi:hypothetical protein
MGMAEPELEVCLFFPQDVGKDIENCIKTLQPNLIYFCKCTYIDNMANDASRGSLFYILQKESLANEVKPVDV